MYRRIIMWVTACFLGIAAFSLTEKAADAVTIVLDAGHDDTHTGARGNGVQEEMANLQIALSCRNELLKYEGVTVYMIRDSGPCPYGGSSAGSSTACNGKRVDFAASVGANVYISLHNNSSTNTNARGASVYYPTTNYNYGCGITGQGLAQAIQNQLVAAGLQNRGISVRYSGDNTRYPDGSLADYYGVIRRSKLKGIPAIIVEHAFVSNYSDAVEFLGSYEKMWRLGQLDAAAIAGYYGLQKRVELDYSQAVLSAGAKNSNTEYELKISGVYGASSVQFAVWSENGGQDDLVMYEGSSDGYGNWTATVPVWKHATEGRYFVDAYVNWSAYMRSTQFQVHGPSASAMNFININNEKGSFDVQLLGLKSDTEIAAVSAGIWHKADQSDIQWVAFQKNPDGTYSYHVDMERYGYEYGTYLVHVYVLDRNGITKCVAAQNVELKPSEAVLQFNKGRFPWVTEVQAQHVPYAGVVRSLEYAFLKEDGTEVLRIKSSLSSGQWKAEFDETKLGDAGKYRIQVYAVLAGGRKVSVGESDYIAEELLKEVMPETEGDITFWNGDTVKVETTESDRTNVLLQIDPWRNYQWIDDTFDADKRYANVLAYELAWRDVDDNSTKTVAEMPGSGEAVDAVTDDAVEIPSGEAVGAVTDDAVEIPTGEAVDAVSDEAVISFLVPDEMKNTHLEVLFASDVSKTSFIPLKYTWSEDGNYVIVNKKPQGIFVLAECYDRIVGDADSDGEITLGDAVCVLRAALHIQSLKSAVVPYCDIDKDDRITLTDAQRILQAALKISSL